MGITASRYAERAPLGAKLAGVEFIDGTAGPRRAFTKASAPAQKFEDKVTAK